MIFFEILASNHSPYAEEIIFHHFYIVDTHAYIERNCSCLQGFFFLQFFSSPLFFFSIKIQNFRSLFHHNNMASTASTASVRWQSLNELKVIEKYDDVLKSSRDSSEVLFVILFNEG